MIKGVKDTPIDALLSSKQSSSRDLLVSEKYPSKLSLINEGLEADLSKEVHITVLLEEAVRALAVKADGVYIDGTFGRGGHSKLILEHLGVSGRLIAFDRDLKAIASSQDINDPRFTILHCHFAAMKEQLAGLGITQVDGILLDLGISSPQIDEGSRGFSFRYDAPLDMRMDQSGGQTAADYLAATTEQHLAEVIKNYGEERFAKQIARAIIAERNDGRPISTTRQLAKVVADTVTRFEPGQNPATRTFQALRIYINQELEELSLTMPQCLSLLANKGRLAVISFHSLEDRIVKQFIRDQENRDHFPTNFPVRAAELPQPKLKSVGKAIRPGAAEIKRNQRSRSAVLRVAERTDVL